jgi:hypothetical protein
MSINDPHPTDPTGTGTGATDAETDDQPSRPVTDHGGDVPDAVGPDVNAGTRADDADAGDADAAREANEERLNADRAAASLDVARDSVPTDPRSGGFDPPDAPNV